MNHSGRILAVILGAFIYLGYVGLCIGMEPIARTRARVLSNADVAALGSPSADAARARGMKRMYAWPPYLGYLTIVTAVVLGGSVGGALLAQRRRVLVFVAVFAILAAPPVLSRLRAESHRTGFITLLPRGEGARSADEGLVIARAKPSPAFGTLSRTREREGRYRVLVSPRGVDLTSAFSRSMPWRLSSMAWRM